jgi:uncharacterized damage-inducible protein DinB
MPSEAMKINQDRESIAKCFIDELDVCRRKLERFTSGLSQEELNWTPAGVNNSISWILVHLATSLWVCHALATNNMTKHNPLAAGLAVSAVRGIKFGKETRFSNPSTAEPLVYLKEALDAVRISFIANEKDLEMREVYMDKKWHPAWWFLTHEVGDFAYHTGQASYLRKLIAHKRKGSK